MERNRKRIYKKTFKVDCLSEKVLSFGECATNLKYFTNQYTLVSSDQESALDRFRDHQGCFGYPSLTVEQALEYASRRAGIANEDLKLERKKVLLNLFCLEEKKSRQLRELSQGEQKKALMAMELFPMKGNLLLRNPLKNLDEFSARRLKTLLWLISQEKERGFRISVTG